MLEAWEGVQLARRQLEVKLTTALLALAYQLNKLEKLSCGMTQRQGTAWDRFQLDFKDQDQREVWDSYKLP